MKISTFEFWHCIVLSALATYLVCAMIVRGESLPRHIIFLASLAVSCAVFFVLYTFVKSLT